MRGDDDDPVPLGTRHLLTEDELAVGRAITQLLPLLEALIERPFARHLYERMRAYLEFEGYDAADAYERMAAQDPAVLSARLSLLEGRSEPRW
jgi:hypothetical protein